MIIENLSTFKIHKLTKTQYERELAAGRIEQNSIYLIPEEDIDLSIYATEEYVDSVFNPYILNIDYNLLAFDTSEIVIQGSASSTSSILGSAVLGQMVLG